MVDKTLLNYVEQVYVLESEQYTLSQVIEKLKQECNRKKNCIREEKVNRNFRQVEEKSSAGGIAEICFGVFIAMGGLASASAIMFVYFIVAFFVICDGASRCSYASSFNKKAEEERQTAIAEADRQLRNIQKENAELREACQRLENSITEFEKLYTEKNLALQHMYNYDIVHKNYRNFYGISKIYHLLDTGICDTLTGVEGAYSQMRTDQIIDNQKISIEIQKNILAANQMMYSAVNRTNDLLGVIGNQINVQNTTNNQLLNDIKNNTEVSNFLIESANNNAKALSSSVEYLAYAEREKRIVDGHLY